jgi:inosine-uridine nucleoside N-ribohydrolase
LKKQPIFLDVDTGVDDALAIILALRSPEFSVEGISTVSGNVPLAQTTANTLTVLDILDAPPIPVAAGAAAPLARSGITAGEVHGSDGLGGTARTFPPSRRRAGEDAVGLLLETIRRFAGTLVLIATGPLTNVALAVRRDPDVMRRLGSLVVMGGAIRAPGNVGPVSEFNFAVDPEAAAIVLGAGLPLTLVPLDVTERVTLTRGLVDETNQDGKIATFVRRITATTIAFHREHEGTQGLFLHDPLAVGVALDPSLVRCEPMAVAVETQGALTAGMVVADLRRRKRAAPTVNVCIEVEADRFLGLFTERVLS